MMKLFTAISHDARLLRHFLDHYRRAGITHFFIAVDPKFGAIAADLQGSYNITLYTDLDVADAIMGGAAAITEMRRDHQAPEEWVAVVDLDEFVEFEGELQTVTRLAEEERANVVRAVMWDRFTREGQPAPFADDADLDRLFPIRARFVKNVMHGTDIKAVLVKGLLIARGAHHHFKNEIVCSHELTLSHFKWIDDALARFRTAYRMVADAGIPWAEEYARALEHYDRHGRFQWEEFGGEYVAPPLPRHLREGYRLTAEDIELLSAAVFRRDANLQLLRQRQRADQERYDYLWREYEYYLEQSRNLKAELDALAETEPQPMPASSLREGGAPGAADIETILEQAVSSRKRAKLLSNRLSEAQQKLAHTWKEYEFYLARTRQLETELTEMKQKHGTD